MKKAIAIVACLAGLACVQALGEKTVVFANLASGVNAPITLLTADGDRVPVGTDYLAQLWAGPSADAITKVGDPVGFAPVAGYFNGGNRDVEAAIAGGNGDSVIVIQAYKADTPSMVGLSAPITIAAANLGGGTVPPSVLSGLASFAIVPEPSTIALGLLGAAFLFLRRRK